MLTKLNISKVKSKKSKVLFGIFILFVFFSPLFSYSQCAMCRAALEGEGNVAQAKAINDGIVYLMVIPYVLVIVAGYAIYRIMRKKKN